MDLQDVVWIGDSGADGFRLIYTELRGYDSLACKIVDDIARFVLPKFRYHSSLILYAMSKKTRWSE